MTDKINQSTSLPESGEETKNLQTKNGEILDSISGSGTLNLDPEVLKTLLNEDEFKQEEFQKVSSIEDIDNLVNEGINSLKIDSIKKMILLLQKYNNSYLDKKNHILVQQFIERNQIESMDEKFLALSEDARILIAIYRSKIRKYSYSCGGGFGYYKTPTGCSGCISGRENMEKAKLDHLAKYVGDRQYQVPKQRIEQAQSNFLKEVDGNIESPTYELDKLIKIYSSKLKECEEKLKTNNAIKEIKSNNENIDDSILTSIPGLISHIVNQPDSKKIKVDIPNKVAAYLEGTVRDSKSAGMEYGNYVAVRYDGKRKDVHVVYRDAYDSHKDDRSLCFSQIEILKTETKDDNIYITVKASSDKNSRTYTFDFPLAKEEKPGLSKEAQEKFTQTFETKKQEILIEQIKRYESNTMPVYCLPSEMMFNNMPGGEVPYIRPTISSEYMDKQNGIGVIVIYKQIDHCASHKRQLAREGRLIKQDGTYDRVSYENMRDDQRLSGKQIKMFAQEIIQDYLNK